jgi:hypothetical protein
VDGCDDRDGDKDEQPRPVGSADVSTDETTGEKQVQGLSQGQTAAVVLSVGLGVVVAGYGLAGSYVAVSELAARHDAVGQSPLRPAVYRFPSRSPVRPSTPSGAGKIVVKVAFSRRVTTESPSRPVSPLASPTTRADPTTAAAAREEMTRARLPERQFHISSWYGRQLRRQRWNRSGSSPFYASDLSTVRIHALRPP